MNKIKQQYIPILFGLFIVLFFSGTLYFKPLFTNDLIGFFNNWEYDSFVKKNHRPLGKNPLITIVDIDDKSLKEIGQWPWSREVIAKLVSKLFQMNATVIGIDILFSEEEKNIVGELLQAIPKPDPAIPTLEKIESDFNYDQLLANALKMGDSVLPTIFYPENVPPSGLLPPPLMTLDNKSLKNLNILKMNSYLSNIPTIENGAKTGGFINSIPDSDGILRSVPLLLRFGDQVYGSLALRTAALYLLTKQTELVTHLYDDKPVLEGIKLDEYFIPTDPQGQVLIPFRGPPYSFPYISAIDVLNNQVDPKKIENQIVFIGISATSLTELKPAAVSPLYVGVEVHASIAAGMLDRYFPYEPTWAKGTIIFTTFLFGLFLSVLFPLIGPILGLIVATVVSGSLLLLKHFLWNQDQIVISFLFPVFLILFLYILNLIYGYVSESKRRKMINFVFGQYVSPEYINIMMTKGLESTLQGESKNLTVLFADIENFTSITEHLSAPEIKKVLDYFFSPMTEIIFENQGTVDKYVGDMIMAFWGAPLENPRHAFFAVKAALQMQNRLENELNVHLREMNQPPIHQRIGLNTGIMDVGDMGSKYRRTYTVLGDTVNLASRLENICRYYHVNILVGQNTWEETKQEFAYRKIDSVIVKGKSIAVDIYQPICLISELTDDLSRELERHHAALEFYQKQEWDRSEKIFSELKATYPKNSSLYDVYLGRINQFRLHPPSPSWQGVHIYEEK